MLTVIEENLKTNGTLYEWKIGYQIIQTASDKIFTLKVRKCTNLLEM